MKKYLLDTNICIYFLKGQFDIHQKIESVGIENCFISEITLAELKYGVENSKHKVKNKKVLEEFQDKFNVLPIYFSLDFYAKEKARLKTKGKIVDDFDLLIGASAVVNKLILVTRNVKDFDRLTDIKIENWVE